MTKQNEAIVALETQFWQAMVDKDAPAAKAMIAEECLIAGPMGAMKIDPEKYAQMTRDGKWTLATFEFSDVSVVCPSEGSAVIAYKVHQTGTVGDKPMDMTCADASTWVREGSDWKCALHTETVLTAPK